LDRGDGHAAFHLHELQQRHLLDEHTRSRARPLDALLPCAAHAAVRLLELWVVPGRGGVKHAPGAYAPSPARDEDRPHVPGRCHRRGDGQLLSLLLHHAVARAAGARGPWAQFHTHLYSNFYVYQYATGIAAADHLVGRVAAGDEKAVESYRAFLRSAGSMYPLEGLRMAGVDMTSPEPVEAAFATLASMV